MKRFSSHKPSKIRVRIFFGILTCLVCVFALVLTADPERRFGFLRDATRRQGVRQILSDIEFVRRSENGAVTSGIDATFETFQMLGTATDGCAHTCGAIPTEDACLTLQDSWIISPKDPQSGTEEQTGYAVNRTASGRMEVVACHSERTREIRLRR